MLSVPSSLRTQSIVGSVGCYATPEVPTTNRKKDSFKKRTPRIEDASSSELLQGVQLVPNLSPSQVEQQGASTESPAIQSESLLRMILESQSSEQAVLKATEQDFVNLFQLWEDALPPIGSISHSSRRDTAFSEHDKEIMIQSGYYTQQLIEAWTVLYQEGRIATAPSIIVCEQVMRIMSSSRAKGMDRACRTLFDDCTAVFHLSSPTLPIYHSLITALGKSRDKGAAHRAETFLRQAAEQFPPTADGDGIKIDTFNVVMTAWAKSGFQYGPERAEKLIYLMDELDQQYLGGQGIFRPSVSSFTSLLDAYAQTLEWDSVSQAERIFNRLLDEYLETGQRDLEPNVATWTIVLSAWAKLSRKNNRGAAVRANRLLERMESLHKEGRISFGPDAIVYISTMNAWAFSKTTEGPQCATDILLEMYERYLDGDNTMKPSAKNIRVVLEAWIGSEEGDAMEQAEKLMDAFVDHLDTMLTSTTQADMSDETVREAVSDVYRTMLYGWSRRDKPRQVCSKYMILLCNLWGIANR